MHSKQINFYLTTSDQVELLNDLRRRGEFLVASCADKGRNLRLVEVSKVKDISAEPLQVYLVRPCDVAGVCIRTLENQRRYVDSLRSPVVQFSRSLHRGNELTRGRLYVTTAYYDGEILVRKEDGFVEWASALILTARRKLKRDSATQSYFGEDAFRLKQSGIELAL
jgi:hypothetical protein